MTDTKNALAELAERLYAICMHTSRSNGLDEIAKAQRIIAELAKVSLYESIYCKGFFTADVNTVDVIVKCRAIADEGVNNGK